MFFVQLWVLFRVSFTVCGVSEDCEDRIVRIVRTARTEDWGLWEQMLVVFATLSPDLRLYHKICDFGIRICGNMSVVFATLSSDLRLYHQICTATLLDLHGDFIISFATLSSVARIPSGSTMTICHTIFHDMCKINAQTNTFERANR